MQVNELFEVTKPSNIAAQLDSNGKEVKVDKVSSARITVGHDLESTETFTKTGGYRKFFKIVKSNTTHVWLDMIDKDGNPVEYHSGKEYAYKISIKSFNKDYKKF